MLAWMKGHRLFTVAALVVALALVGAAPALASRTITGGDVVIDEDVDDDLYVTGQNVIVNATIDGDLIAFGQTVTINGTVTGDALVGAQVVELSGTVEDDARLGGMIVKLYDGATVGDDLNGAGWAVDMEPGSRVGGTMYAAGGQVRVADVAEDFGGGAEGVRIVGTVGGDVEASVGDGTTQSFFNPSMVTMGQDIELPSVPTLPSGLTFAEGGAVEGDLNYSSAAEQSIPAAAVGGAVGFTLEQPDQPDEAEAAGRSAVVKFAGRFLGTGVMLLLVGLLVTAVAPAFLENTLSTIRERPLASLGVGAAGYVALIAILILLVVVGVLLMIPLGAVGAAGRFTGLLLTAGTGTVLAFNVLVRWVAPIAVALLAGRAVFRLFGGERVAPVFWPLLIGGFGVSLLLAIPVLRLLGAFLIGAIGLGAAALVLWPRRGGAPEPVEPVVTAPDADTAEPSPVEPVDDKPAE